MTKPDWRAKARLLAAARRAMAANARINKLYNSPEARTETTFTDGPYHYNAAVARMTGAAPDPYIAAIFKLRAEQERENKKWPPQQKTVLARLTAINAELARRAAQWFAELPNGVPLTPRELGQFDAQRPHLNTPTKEPS